MLVNDRFSSNQRYYQRGKDGIVLSLTLPSLTCIPIRVLIYTGVPIKALLECVCVHNAQGILLVSFSNQNTGFCNATHLWLITYLTLHKVSHHHLPPSPCCNWGYAYVCVCVCLSVCFWLGIIRGRNKANKRVGGFCRRHRVRVCVCVCRYACMWLYH